MTGAFGIIGCRHGHIAVFIEEMLQLGWACAGIYDPHDRGLAERLAVQFNVPLLDSREPLADPSVRFIGSSAVNSSKIEIIEWCEQHGKAVMVDKPAVTDRAGLQRLRQVIDRGRIEIGMLLTERFRPSLTTLKRRIDAGELGTIVSLTMRKPHRLSPASRGAWHFSKADNGGLIVDLLVHDLDLVRWLTGQEIATVQGIKTKTILPEYPEFYDTACVQVMTDGGTAAQLYTDWHTPSASWTWGDCRVFVSGTHGSAELRLTGDPTLNERGEVYLQVSGDSGFHRIPLDEAGMSITEDFVRRAQGMPGPYLLGGQDVLEASRLSVEADEAAIAVDRTR